MDYLPVKRALLSVTDKTGLADFAGFLVSGGVELVSTGGTMKTIAEAGIKVTSVKDVTGFPEIMDGRVKTLHPFIHGGILADKDNPAHLKTLEELGIRTFDLICVNLYNFRKAASAGKDLRSAIEEIDIGGPTLLRAAAKNFHSILVVPGVEYYSGIKAELSENGFKVGLKLRLETSAATFAMTSEYDAMIAGYLRSGL